MRMLSGTESIPSISAADAGDICQMFVRSLSHKPQEYMLRGLFMVVSLISIRGHVDPEPEIGRQLINIIQVRGITDSDRMSSTLNTVWKIFEGTGGRVTPRDLISALRSSGRIARTLSDAGLISLATMLWEQKEARGEP